MRNGFWGEAAVVCLAMSFCVGSGGEFSDSYRRL